MRIALFDYGAGNLHSLGKGLESAGAEIVTTSDWDEALALDALVLPGVGAFGQAARALPEDRTPVRDALAGGLPCLGICLGMQLLFDESEESMGTGIGLVPGGVRRLRAEVVPQMGWNDVETGDDPVFAGIPALTAYYANSYVCEPQDTADGIAWSEYEGKRFIAAVRRANSWGIQFHPEKSSGPGRRILANFVSLAEKGSAAMIAIPAVDLKGGRCVQLVGGRPEDERVSLPDPAVVARQWWQMGFGTLHLVDLDAALGSGDNLGTLTDLLAATPAVTQVGGGIRDDARADALVAAGADRVIVGTRALDDPDWLAALARRLPNRVVVAADTRDGFVLRKGWTESSGIAVAECLARLGDLPLAGVLVTDVGQEGRLEGIDSEAVAAILRTTPLPIWISGGVTTEDELAFLTEKGAAGAVLGMALYTETLDPVSVGRRWGGRDNNESDS